MLRLVLAALLIGGALAVLTLARSDVQITRGGIGQTPVTEYAMPGAEGPQVVIAHGFAGSQPMMQGYVLPLARAGYRVKTFDFLGHGRNPVPMSGDVTAVDGTTGLLVAQVSKVLDAVAEGDAPVALMGHSMATDVLVRVAQQRQDVGPLVLISAFSQEITATAPTSMLLITGAWEPGLRAFALDAVQMVQDGAIPGQTVEQGDVQRRAVIAPASEHVAVLHSRVGRAEALAWLDQFYDRSSDVRVLPSGWAILALLFGVVLIFKPLLRWVGSQPPSAPDLSLRQTGALVLMPMLLAPLVAVVPHPAFLPVLVADHLMLHLLIFGGLQLGLLRRWGIPIGAFDLRAFGVVLFWSAAFGLALNAFAATFWPTGARWWIVVVIALGAVPYMLADATLAAILPLWRRLALRAGFIASLILAVVLDFEGLFFLIMIAPVMILFYAIFGTVGRATARKSGPLAPGIALGLVLAWALGVSFPLFQA